MPTVLDVAINGVLIPISVIVWVVTILFVVIQIGEFFSWLYHNL